MSHTYPRMHANIHTVALLPTHTDFKQTDGWSLNRWNKESCERLIDESERIPVFLSSCYIRTPSGYTEAWCYSLLPQCLSLIQTSLKSQTHWHILSPDISILYHTYMFVKVIFSIACSEVQMPGDTSTVVHINLFMSSPLVLCTIVKLQNYCSFCVYKVTELFTQWS